MVRPSSVDPDKVQKCIKYLKNRPDMKVPEAMKLANFFVEEVADLSLRQFIQRSLPGKMLTDLKAHTLGSLPPPPPQPDCAERGLNRAINYEGAVIEPDPRACAIAVTPSPLLPRPPPVATPQNGPSSSAVSMTSAASMTVTLTIAANKRKIWNQAYYAKKKKLRLLDFEPDATAADYTAVADATAVATTTATNAVATADSAFAVAALTNGLSIIAKVLPPPPPPPPLTVPLPSLADSRLSPTLPQQLIHDLLMPMTPCACQRRARWQRVGR
jgi:hypothetical protein